MTLLGRFAPSYATSLALLLGSLSACSSNGSDEFSNGGTGNKGGSTSTTPTTTEGGSGSSSSSNPNDNPTAGTSSVAPISDAGVYVPDSTVVEDPDTYTTSCETENCTGDEACFESCPNGSCCVHACEGQTGSTSGEVACCDQMGGIVPGASCK